MHAVAMPGGLVAFEFQPDQGALRGRFAPLQRRAADEVVLLSLQRDREPDPGLERVDLVAEFIPGEDQARLDSEHVQCVQAQRGQPMTRTRLPYRVPQRERVLRMTPQFVAELTGVPGARDEQRQPLRSAEPPDREPEPAEIGKGGLGRWRP